MTEVGWAFGYPTPEIASKNKIQLEALRAGQSELWAANGGALHQHFSAPALPSLPFAAFYSQIHHRVTAP